MSDIKQEKSDSVGERPLIEEEYSGECSCDADEMLPPSKDQLLTQIDGAWENRQAADRFREDGKTGVFFSGGAESSEYRRSILEKKPEDIIHSGELAERHIKDQKNTVTLMDTKGGKELSQIDFWIKSSAFTPAESDELEAAIKPLWEDASMRFAQWVRETPHSVAYIQNANAERVYRTIERPVLSENHDHRHMTDIPLDADGRPPELDQYHSQDLDDEGRMYKA